MRSPGVRVMPGSASLRVRLRRTETGKQAGGQVMVPSGWPEAGESGPMVTSRSW